MPHPEPFDRGLPAPVTCEVCRAPALPLDGACPFCGSALTERGDPAGLLDYLAMSLPGVTVSRAGLLHRGPIQRVEFTLGDTAFRVQTQGEGLAFQPALSPERWAARVVRAVGEAAADNAELRRLLSRAGWLWPA